MTQRDSARLRFSQNERLFNKIYFYGFVCFWILFLFFSENKVMFQCSICTAGSAFCSLDPEQMCKKCGLYAAHVCSRCIAEASGVMPMRCHLCTQREHICLSKCLRGCVLREKPNCQCSKGPTRLQVQKKNKNHGRYFWTCRYCNFFEWESTL